MTQHQLLNSSEIFLRLDGLSVISSRSGDGGELFANLEFGQKLKNAWLEERFKKFQKKRQLPSKRTKKTKKEHFLVKSLSNTSTEFSSEIKDELK